MFCVAHFPVINQFHEFCRRSPPLHNSQSISLSFVGLSSYYTVKVDAIYLKCCVIGLSAASASSWLSSCHFLNLFSWLHRPLLTYTQVLCCFSSNLLDSQQPHCITLLTLCWQLILTNAFPCRIKNHQAPQFWRRTIQAFTIFWLSSQCISLLALLPS